MESLKPKSDAEPNREPVPLQDARFIDPLEPEHEEMWRDLIEHVRTIGGPFEEKLIPLWSDDRLPQAFRDRVMLVGALCEGRFELGVETQCVTWGFGGGLKGLKKFAGFDDKKFADWYKDGLTYEAEKETDVFGLYTRLNWAFSLYKEELISDEELDVVLNTLPPPLPDERFIPRDEMPLSAERILRLELFGRMDDYDEDYVKPDPKIYAWALEKLQAWFLHETGGQDDLPKWLQGLSTEQGQEIFSKLIRKSLSDKKGKARAWQEFEPLINHFGWSIVLYQGQIEHRDQLRHVLEIIESIGAQNFGMQVSLLQNILDRKNENLPFLDYLETFEKVIKASGSEKLHRILATEKEKLRQYKINQAAADARFQQRTTRKKEGERAAKEKDTKKFEGVLEIIRRHG